jgi:Protein of unknown function (DUF3568)
MARLISSLLVVVAALGSAGCAALAIPLFVTGAGTAAGTGVGYTLDSITYKTFTVPIDGMNTATLMTLERMDITLVDNQITDSGRTITAQAADRTIDIELDRLTSRATRMRVVARRNWFVQDRATATEVILQTDRTLSNNPQLAANPAPAAGNPTPVAGNTPAPVAGNTRPRAR